MRNYRNTIERFLEDNEINTQKIKQMTGSSNSSVFLVNKKIYRIGLKSDINKSISAYSKFKKSLSDYDAIFPWVKLIKNGYISIAQMEYVGADSFEKIILRLNENRSGLINLNKINKEVLKNLRKIYQETKLKKNSSENIKQNKLFLNELLKAFVINFKKSGLAKEGDLFLKKLNEKSEIFIDKATASLAHKDLSVGNVVVLNDNKSVKFIDPRSAVPYGIKSNAMGNVAIDLAGYLVSLERKELELKHKDPTLSLKALREEVYDEIVRCISEEIFSDEFFKICVIFWYSVYAACKCEYCTCFERKWLYDVMIKRLKKMLEK